ncbi:uncharacterized protein PODANS_2_9250 [Podospora anserina S mat+]|uniref:Podospora anserina S mat+ genomic DNA chromosome 2, supercontig 2 n=1 Tax=Podospora anserina (strain S / ATCC MYA-4624 / DSM 980 / FGSC 10383) TaxID=515849 RepID=B2B6Y0_PODAN|nr:uncharacterized protein PODANS_2_9250 [Podospora anserina S mat+]CAP73558.1 unnamed protein product [Podospora anserina S mat+]CDP25961.1 Putative protein of unknown function [Podospora anserina S mat+]
MGLLEPLISMALGRSPYDEVIFPNTSQQNEQDNEHDGYRQLYDERGRPINPETRRINRDVVRSHNEVMTVIGVAEPDNGPDDAHAMSSHRHNVYEDRWGNRLLNLGGVLDTACVWGVNGMRQRILLYKRYSRVPFTETFALARQDQSLAAHFLGGLPAFGLNAVIDRMVAPKVKEYPILGYASMYIRLHLVVYTTFQRFGIIPATELLPNWRFFIPGSSISPIVVPPLPTSLCPVGILKWIGGTLLGVAPLGGFFAYMIVYNHVAKFFRMKIINNLPLPGNPRPAKRRALQDITPVPPTFTLEIPPPVDQHPVVSGSSSTPPPATAPTQQQQPQPTTRTAEVPPRRQSITTTTTPGAGIPLVTDDYASEEEELEVSATLISFDVEAADSSNTLSGNFSSNPAETINSANPGIWSAELRPNPSENNRAAQASRERTFRDNKLRRLPAALATDVFAIGPSRLIMSPVAALCWTAMIRPYLARAGRWGELEGVNEVGLWGAFSWEGVSSLVGMELVLFNLMGSVWTVVSGLAWTVKMDEEEWEECGEGLRGEEQEGEEER